MITIASYLNILHQPYFGGSNRQAVISFCFTFISFLYQSLQIYYAKIRRALSKRKHFDILQNARSSKASRSRKSSIHNLEKFQKERPLNKTKKLRKMILNPESFRYQQILQIEEMHNQHKATKSQKGDKDQLMDFEDILQLGGLAKTESKKERELQNGIFVGIGNERDLDSDFDLSGGWTHNTKIDLQMHQ